MALNTIEAATLFQTALDKLMIQTAASGFMEANAGQIIYNGGNEVKIPKLNMDGLANYDRDNGFTTGGVSLSYETKTMSMDRGRSFQLDENTVNESNFVASASNVMAEFQRLYVVPEVDAYRFSKIAALAIAAGRAFGGFTPTADNIYDELVNDIAAIQDVTGSLNFVIIMSWATKNVLDKSSKMTRVLSANTGGSDLNNQVAAINGNPIIVVPSSRLKTAYVFNDGKTTGQTTGGFTPDASAKTINWIIMPPTAPIAVSKTDAIRIFDPSTNQKARAWGMDYRKFHDLWIPENKMPQIYVSIREALA